MINDMSKFPPFKHKIFPFKHQLEDLEYSKERKDFALLHEMGCGKSKILLDTAQWLYLKGEIDGLLIVSDKGCFTSWEVDHIPAFWPEHLPFRAYTWQSYDTKKNTMKKEAILRAQDNVFDFAMINIDALATPKGKAFAALFLQNHYAMMTVDESTSIKNIKAQRTKAAIGLGRLAEYRRIITGTPIANRPLDCFAQFEFLRPGILGFTSYTAFKHTFAVLREVIMGNRRFEQIVGAKNTDLLRELIMPHSRRRLKKDCLDLPEKIYEIIYIEHTPEQARAYHDLKKYALHQFKEGLVTVDNALTLLMRLQQINSGHLTADDGSLVSIPSNRLSTLLQQLEASDGKVVIWAKFREDIRQIMEALAHHYGPQAAVHYYGETTSKERVEALARFGHEDSCRFFVSNPTSGGKGLNDLVVSSDVIYYSNDWRLEARLQSEDRNHRPGQRNNVTYRDFVVRGTVDSAILKAQRDKQDIANLVLTDISQLFQSPDELS